MKFIDRCLAVMNDKKPIQKGNKNFNLKTTASRDGTDGLHYFHQMLILGLKFKATVEA